MSAMATPNLLAARVRAALKTAQLAGHVAPVAPGRVRVYVPPTGAGRAANLAAIAPTLARVGAVAEATSKLGQPCLEVRE